MADFEPVVKHVGGIVEEAISGTAGWHDEVASQGDFGATRRKTALNSAARIDERLSP